MECSWFTIRFENFKFNMDLFIPFVAKLAILFAYYKKQLTRKSIKKRFLIHCNLFTNLLSFWNPINLVSLESQGRLEHQYTFIKKRDSEVEKNEDKRIATFDLIKPRSPLLHKKNFNPSWSWIVRFFLRKFHKDKKQALILPYPSILFFLKITTV